MIAASVACSIYETTIVGWVEPWKAKILSYWWSWMVAVALLVVFAIPPMVRSFPPERQIWELIV